MSARRSALNRIHVALVAGVLSIGLSPIAFAAPKVPSTPAEHSALAKQYRDKAATYKKEAAEHREMAAEYKKSRLGGAHEAQGQKDPKVVEMEKHCAAIATKADALAVENEKAADFHDLRAKELKGK